MNLHITASSLHRVEICPASASGTRIEQVHADATAGTEAHATREAEELRPGYRSEVALAFNVLTGEGRELPKQAHRAYPDMGEGWILGTSDTIGITDADGLVVEDFKAGAGFGVAHPRDNLQLAFYALAAARAHGLTGATVRIVFSDGRVLEHKHDDMDLLAFEERIRRVYVAAHAPEPRIIESDAGCWRCPRLPRCEAKVGLAVSFSEGVDQRLFPTLELTTESVATGWKRLKQIKQVLAQIEGAYRSFAAGQDVPLGDGKVLGAVEKERRELDAGIAYAVLAGEYAQDVALAGVTMEASQASIKRALATVAEKGKGAALVRETLQKIDAAGGVITKHSTVVEEH